MNALLRPGGTGGGGGDSWRKIVVSLGPDAEVSGRLSFTAATRIEGKLKGEIRSTDLLVVGPRATIHATVKVRALVVLGQIEGDVQRADLIDIRPGGRLRGDINTRRLVIADGGRFDGNCTMTEGEREQVLVQGEP